MDTPPDPSVLLRHWDLPVPISAERIPRGTNNLNWRVEMPTGSHVLRIYQNTVYLGHIAYEHALLAQLSGMGLSFAIPTPLPSRTGTTLQPVEMPNGEIFAALFPLIPGERARRGDVIAAELAGAALGELDQALAEISLPPDLPRFPTYGDLDHVHPLVPNPLHLPPDLPLDPARRERFLGFLSEIRESISALYQTLPRQIIHSDYAASNVLVEGNRVSGILDFEFASPDLRVMDLAVGLYQFSLPDDDTGPGLEIAIPFARGYDRYVSLSVQEVEALPALWRLRQVVTTLHRLGRRQQGVATEGDVIERIDDTLRLDEWLRTHGEDLVERVMRSPDVF